MLLKNYIVKEKVASTESANLVSENKHSVHMQNAVSKICLVQYQHSNRVEISRKSASDFIKTEF